MEVPIDVVENLFFEFQKKDINKFMRGQIIKNYMSENKLSGRQFSKNFNLPKSTVEDWLLWTKITSNEYENFKKQGMTHTNIYKMLRYNKDKNVNDMIIESQFDRTLYKFIKSCEICMSQFPPKTNKTNTLLSEAKQALINIEKHYEGN